MAVCDACKRYVKAIDVKKAGRPLLMSVDTVATLAGRMMGTERKLDLFRLINAMTATSSVRPGEKFKIISE